METSRESEVDLALARALLCRALRLGFQKPTKETLGPLFSSEGRQAISAAALLLEDQGLRAAANYLSNLPEPTQDLITDTYDRLFGHTTRGRVCPYETEFGADHLFLQSQQLADIMGYFMAFGLLPKEDVGERVDHIAVQWEFMEFLSEKEAVASLRDDLDMLEETRKAYRSFLRDHLSRFGRAFARTLETEAPGSLYEMLGRLCLSFLTEECQRLVIPLGPELLMLRTGSLDDAPMACGSDSELVQIV